MRTEDGVGAAKVDLLDVFGLLGSLSLAPRDVDDLPRLKDGCVSDLVMLSVLAGDGECSDLESGDVAAAGADALDSGVDPLDSAMSLLLRRDDKGTSSAGGAKATIWTGNNTFCGGDGSGVGGND